MRRSVSALLAGVLLAPALLTGWAPLTEESPADAQSGGRLDFVAQTAWVGDDPAAIDVRVSGAADTARLQIRIFAARTTRDEIRATYDEVPTETPISIFDRGITDSTIGSGNLLTIEIPDDEIGELLRRDQGALPVVIDLLSEDDVTLDSFTTHLLVIDSSRPTLGVALIADLTVPISLQADQSILIDGPSLLDRAEPAVSRPDVPITLDLRPDTLGGLALSDQASLESLIEALAARPILRSPWVDLDEEAWRLVGETDMVIEQYALGLATLEEHLGRGPSTLVRLDTDANPATLGLLRTAGTTGVIVSYDQFSPITQVITRHQPFQVLDDNGLPMTAVGIDTELHETLAGEDPELAAHRALAELAVTAASATTNLGVLLDLDTLNPTALDVLLAGIAERSLLRTISTDRLFELAPTRVESGSLYRGLLRATAAPELSPLAADLQLTRATVESYSTMVAPSTTAVDPLRTQLLAAASADLDGEASRSYVSLVFDAVVAGTSGLEIVPSDRITLTDRKADLPFTIRNNQPLPITVDLLLTAEKLRFPDGDRLTIVLQPGENEQIIRVTTLASGDARVTATLTSPDGRLELGSGVVDIRSTAISGLGLVISMVALLVLAVWWARTILRVRRTRTAATVAPATGDGSGPSQGES